MTPEYTAFYEDPDLGDTLTPGTPQWEYYHFTKRFGYLGVATSCEMRENRFCLYVSDQEIARARKILEQRVNQDNPDGRGWFFSDPSDSGYGHPEGLRVRIELLPERWLTHTGGLESNG